MAVQSWDGSAVPGHVRRALGAAPRQEAPYPHWRPREVLPLPLAEAILALPFAPPAIGDTEGRRETHNATRLFYDAPARAAHPPCAALAETFQAPATIALLEDRCGRPLGGSFLRIEDCQDTEGFWLEPHTDIGAKLFTLLIYLSRQPEAEEWGTDVLDAAGRLCVRVPGTFNTGLAFLPAADTWHGFAKRPIRGVRRSLIINYVAAEWRSRHELAFADQPVRRA